MSNQLTTGGTVLLVEDDPATADLVQYILSHSGFTVRTTPRIREALQLLQHNAFDAAILDYRLPDGNPWQIVEAARAAEPRIPVMITTSAGGEDIAAEATRRGVAEYAIKGEALWNRLPATVERVIGMARAEAQMRSGDALFQLITRHTRDVIIVMSCEGRMRYVSPTCDRILGYQPDDLLDRQIVDFVHPEDRAALESFLSDLRQNGHAVAEYRQRRRTVGYVSFEASGNTLRDSAGGMEVVVISRDISARKHAEERLVENQRLLQSTEERYRNLVESVEDYAILMLDAEGCVASWTVAAERIKGYTADEIVGRHFSCFFTPEDVARSHPEELLRIAATNGRLTEEGVRVRKDGSRFWAAVSITSIRDHTGELRGFSKVTRDITERIEHETQVRQDEEIFRALLESAPDASGGRCAW